MNDLELQRKSLPDEPGVYFFKDKEGKIIYVGKAINLKKRVTSYFSKTKFNDPYYEEKIKYLVKEINSIEYIVTQNEKEAYILENMQIKKNLPRFNVRMRDSKTYPWVFGDDAGLEIDALNGEPGVRTRRWNGVFKADVDDHTWLEYLLKQMESVPPGERTAAFVAGWVLIAPDGEAYCREVRAAFEISTRPIRPISPGSPITSVRIGPVYDLVRRQAEVRSEWEQWGILAKLLRMEARNDREA